MHISARCGPPITGSCKMICDRKFFYYNHAIFARLEIAIYGPKVCLQRTNELVSSLRRAGLL